MESFIKYCWKGGRRMSNIILFSSSPLRIEVCSPTLVVLIADVMVSDCSPSDPPSLQGCPLPLHPLPPSQAYLIFVIFFTQAKFLANKIYTADKNFTRPPVATVATNSKSAPLPCPKLLWLRRSARAQCESQKMSNFWNTVCWFVCHILSVFNLLKLN